MWREISSNFTFCFGSCTEALEDSGEGAFEMSLFTWALFLGDSSVSVTDMLELCGSNSRLIFVLDPCFEFKVGSPFEEAEDGGTG